MALLLVLLVVIEGCGGEGDTPIFCVLLVLVGGSICYMIVGLKPGDGHIFFFFFFFLPLFLLSLFCSFALVVSGLNAWSAGVWLGVNRVNAFFPPLIRFCFPFFCYAFLHEARTFTPAQASQLGGLLLVAWLAQAGFDPALSLLYMYLISSLSYPSCPFPFFFSPQDT